MIKSISIDDEPLAHKIIANYCSELDFIEVTATFKNAVSAIDYLDRHQVDLIFLDINMPLLKGLDFLRTLKSPPMVIITSAYQEHALESFELEVSDYLLKPFSFERFLKAVKRVKNQLSSIKKSELPAITVTSESNNSIGRIFVKSEKKIHQVSLRNVLFLESYGSYVKIHLPDETILTLDRLSNFEKKLPESSFIRVHKSFIVPLHQIKMIEGNRITIGQTKIPIGQVYKININKLIK